MLRIQEWKQARNGRRLKIDGHSHEWRVLLYSVEVGNLAHALGLGHDIESAWNDAVARYERSELELASSAESSAANHGRDGREVA